MLTDEDGEELAELVEDQVHARPLGRQTTAVSWRETEVEIGERAQLELLDRIERELLPAGRAVRPPAPSRAGYSISG